MHVKLTVDGTQGAQVDREAPRLRPVGAFVTESDLSQSSSESLYAPRPRSVLFCAEGDPDSF